MTVSQKLWHLLTSDQRTAVVLLLVLMLIGMMMETLGVGLVIPALALMAQSDVTKYPALSSWLERIGNPTREQLVIAGMLTLVGVYLLKSLFLAFLTWMQMKFVFGVQASLSERLFVGYLRQPYTFHLQRNSAQLINTAVNETNQFTHSGLIAGMTVLTEVLVLLGISALLIVVEPLGALLVVSTLGLAGWGFHRFTRTRVLRWGEARLLHESLRIQHLQQGLGGAKDVKLLGREEEFFAQYRLHNTGSARIGQLQKTLAQLPRLWLELLAVAAFAALVLVVIGQGKPLDTLLPTLGLFAAAAFRLMPSVNRVLNAVQSLRFALPAIDTLYKELHLLNQEKAAMSVDPLPFRKTLALEQIRFRYQDAETDVLRGVSLTIPCGSAVGFIGGSGSGKSTLVDVILGLLSPNSGGVKVDGIDIQANLRGWQNQIGYVPQTIFLTDDTLRRNVAFGLSNDRIDDAAVWRALRAAQLEQFINALPHGLETVVGERGVRLSGGQKQRIGIARALYHDPAVLILDEATSALDTSTEEDVMRAVAALQGDKTVLIVAHRLSTVEHCDSLYVIEQGEVVAHGAAAMVLMSQKGGGL